MPSSLKLDAVSIGGFPSPHSGILFLFVPSRKLPSWHLRFRPLIRGFFFYLGSRESRYVYLQIVSVPSFGDSFFIRGKRTQAPDKCSFRPLIRGFFFYRKIGKLLNELRKRVSVPSFGDSFFIKKTYSDAAECLGISFPSPHSGILFLSVNLMHRHMKNLTVSVPSFGDSFFILLYFSC